jgi:hypothetical protein
MCGRRKEQQGEEKKKIPESAPQTPISPLEGENSGARFSPKAEIAGEA